MTLRIAWILFRVVVEFFSYEAAWAATGLLKVIFLSRIVLVSIPLAAVVFMAQSVVYWPRENGEEHLVLQREFRVEQEYSREMQSDMRSTMRANIITINDLQLRQTRSEEFQKRMEEKFDTGMKILWSMCSLLIVQVLVPLLKLGVRREIARLKET